MRTGALDGRGQRPPGPPATESATTSKNDWALPASVRRAEARQLD